MDATSSRIDKLGISMDSWEPLSTLTELDECFFFETFFDFLSFFERLGEGGGGIATISIIIAVVTACKSLTRLPKTAMSS